MYSLSRDGSRVVALVPDAASAEESRHRVTLWTDITETLVRRAAAARR